MKDSIDFLHLSILKAASKIKSTPKRIEATVDTIYWFAYGTKDPNVNPYFGRRLGNRVTLLLFATSKSSN